MMSIVEELIIEFDVRIPNRRQRLSAIFEPILVSNASAHPSAVVQSLSSDKLLSEISLGNIGHSTERISFIRDKLNDLGMESTFRFLLLAAQQTNASCQNRMKISIRSTSTDSDDDQNTNAIDQGFFDIDDRQLSLAFDDLLPTHDTMSSCFDQNIDTIHRVSFNEILITLQPDRTWIQVPVDELITSIDRLLSGHETWLFYKNQNLMFQLKDDVYVDGISNQSLLNLILPIITLANKFVLFENYCSIEYSDICSSIDNESLTHKALRSSLYYRLRTFRQTISEMLIDRQLNDMHQLTICDLFRMLYDIRHNIQHMNITIDICLPLISTSNTITTSNLLTILGNLRIKYAYDDMMCSTVCDLLSIVYQHIQKCIDLWLYKGQILECDDIFVNNTAVNTQSSMISSCRQQWTDNFGISLPSNFLLSTKLSNLIIQMGKMRRLAQSWDHLTECRKNEDKCDRIVIDQSTVSILPDDHISYLHEMFMDRNFMDRIQLDLINRIGLATTDRLIVDCMHEYRIIFDQTLINLRRIFLHEDRVFSSILTRHFIQLSNDNTTNDPIDDNYAMSPQRLNIVLDAAFCGSMYNYDRESTMKFSFIITNDEKQLSRKDASDNLFVRLKLIYQSSYPLNLTVSKSILDGYSAIWSTLSRLEMSLMRLILIKSELFRQAEMIEYRPLLLYRYLMINFIGALHSYFWNQTIRIIYPHYKIQMDAATTIDTLYSVHKRCIATILTRCFLGPKATSIAIVIDKCLIEANRFCASIEQHKQPHRCAKIGANFQKSSMLFAITIRKLATGNYEPCLRDLLLNVDIVADCNRR